MRKIMKKEVTTTTVTIAKMEMIGGQPQAITLPDEIILGNVTLEKAQKIVNKKYGQPITVFKVSANTQMYEMPVEDFIKVATVVVVEEEK